MWKDEWMEAEVTTVALLESPEQPDVPTGPHCVPAGELRLHAEVGTQGSSLLLQLCVCVCWGKGGWEVGRERGKPDHKSEPRTQACMREAGAF